MHQWYNTMALWFTVYGSFNIVIMTWHLIKIMYIYMSSYFVKQVPLHMQCCGNGSCHSLRYLRTFVQCTCFKVFSTEAPIVQLSSSKNLQYALLYSLGLNTMQCLVDKISYNTVKFIVKHLHRSWITLYIDLRCYCIWIYGLRILLLL